MAARPSHRAPGEQERAQNGQDALFERWPRANATAVVATGLLRSAPEDFDVTERLAFEPAGAGEHLYLFVRKRGMTTRAVQRELAAAAGVALADVSYAGMKDKSAIARQWFSIRRPGQDAFALDERMKVLRRAWHPRKLRRGELCANVFRIRIRAVKGSAAANLELLRETGVPNYFGAQRFGLGGGNIGAALAWVRAGRPRVSRHRRGIHLSSLRSFIFNEALGARVRRGVWQAPLAGEVTMEGAATGPLWGRGRLPGAGCARSIDAAVAAAHGEIVEALEHVGLQHERRRLCLHPQRLRWDVNGETMTVRFALPAGAYATSVLREAGEFHDAGGLGR